MPVQINEIVIRTVVNTEASSGSSQGPQAPPGNTSGEDAEIVEKVLEIIRTKNER